MGIECLHDRSQLRGLSYEKAKLYGMPHIGCKYIREDVNATRWDPDSDYRECACCGKVGGRHSKHHEPPKSQGGHLMLQTPMGCFVLLPALIDLCGSGTEGCHGDRHARKLSIRWEWDSDEYEAMWWDGMFLSHGRKPNGEWLWQYGRYVFEVDGREWEVRK